MRAGDWPILTSRGGKQHTLTKVAAVGGGCVDELNHLVGLSTHLVCGQDADGVPGPERLSTFIGPGGTNPVPHLSKDTRPFECLIRPWLRIAVPAR